MHELIEQRKTNLIQVGGSKYILIPSEFLEQLEINLNTELTLRLCKGKKGKFIDIYKQ